MTTLIPTSQPTGVETYEDMFKEITRKLYGEETGHGLHTLGTPVAHVATGGPTVPEGERSFTTLISDRSLASIDYDHGAGNESNNPFKNDDHLTTAFGLAALMQNGFPTPGAILNSHSFQQMNKQQNTASASVGSNNVNNSVTVPSGNNSNVEEKWNPQHHSDDLVTPWNSKNQSSFPTSGKLFKIKKQEALESSSSASAPKTQTTGNNTANAVAPAGQKRYNCSNCPYSTDRRDLFTRHENIHKEEKPFHCYVCLKQFNRADHVKKHFLRMHRGLAYDIGRTKRTLTQQQQAATSNNKKSTNNGNAAGSNNGSYFNHQQQPTATTLNIPTNTSYQSSQSAGNNHVNANQQQMSVQQQINQGNVKSEKATDKSAKKKGDKRFICCYCTWSGSDNWGLKRHLNTHTKPYVCMLCDYKAARSERLATHVFKVHNKKVCTKCNYLADNQDDYDAHVYEAHAHEARPQRNNQSNNNSGSETTANVLRSINNSFNVPNSQLNTIHGVSTSHVFGGSSSNTNNANANANTNVHNNSTSNIYSNNLHQSSAGNGSMSNNILTSNQQNLSNNWRNDGDGNSSASQKRGAERLFQYMEADGSDPEDYTRQMQMAALSRNTASVAQDFHNAGGGVKTFTISTSLNEDIIKQMIINHMKTASNELSSNGANDQATKTTIIINNNGGDARNAVTIKTEPSTSEYEATVTAAYTQSVSAAAATTAAVAAAAATSKTMSRNVSPPAYHPSAKKRRKSSTHEKENENIYLSSMTSYTKNNEQQQPNATNNSTLSPSAISSKQGLDNYIRATRISTGKSSLKFPSGLEVHALGNVSPTVAFPMDTSRHTDTAGSSATCLTRSEKRRKQAQPRKCVDAKADGSSTDYPTVMDLDDGPSPDMAEPASSLSSIRDKHLDRMVSKKKSCNICSKSNSCMVMPYHGTTSLMLHKMWRHSQHKYTCKRCGASFNKQYKCIIHKKLQHNMKIIKPSRQNQYRCH